ncbi:NAD(P)/FAD-dependent oxidoreductase [Salinisphaera sp. P385]|uniref:NADH:ubiquinone reductase (non-electrogenic) n=1 Tax=Spectribacter acetivorans TaxID=3075603 RepID=A0ABU3B8N0_9GAMM|nr:NAD(P)/FAD-dependent oxidoreductase [Salinisphaera sp. P385]MDT0618833.1 NAD(P)/FAD-dependent oxidoreductase [Salinisphaera sp. P385]
MSQNHPVPDGHRVVIIGGGFGGLFAAQSLGKSGYDVTLLDKRNFHLFQPLLYQVTAGTLTTGDICVPHRVLLRRYKNVRALMSTAYDVDPQARTVRHEFGEVGYDTLIVATGVKHHYFGNDDWAEYAPGLKTIEHALRMRRRIFNAFEMAELEADTERRREWLTFVIVGGGPTGVELAGAVGELANRTMVGDFRAVDPRDARILLVEGADRVLPTYPEALSRRAQEMLEELGVTVVRSTMVEDIGEGSVRMKGPDGSETVSARTVLWAAGVRASSFGVRLAERTGTEPDRGGRMRVNDDLSLPDHPDIFVIGDLARCNDANGRDVPGLAPAAIQQGEYVAKLLKRRAKGKPDKPFKYTDKGTMAVIGRNRAVGDLNGFKVWGFPAWLLWVFVHIYALIGNERRLRVMLQWIWKYFTRKTGDRLVTGRPAKTRDIQHRHETG